MSQVHDDSGDLADQHPQPQRFDWEALLRNSALVIVLLLLLWSVFNVQLPSASRLRDMIETWGWAAWLVFIATYAVVAMTPVPVTVMAVTAGLLFGVVEGTVLSVIGVLIGCWAAYWLARGLGRQVTIKLLGSHNRNVQRHLSQAGFQAVVMLRLLPGFPYWPINYGSGAFGVGQREFMLASVVSVVPGQVSLVAIGSFISTPDILHGVLVGAGWVVVLVLTIWAYRKWNAARSGIGSPDQST